MSKRARLRPLLNPRMIGLALLCACGAALAQTPAAPAPAAPAAPATHLPDGANAIQETFGDWRVACLTRDKVKRCSMTQEQANSKTQQRVLAIELGGGADKLEGILVLPFGVALERGVALQLDDQAAQAPLRYSTCLPAGCIVPVRFDAKFVTALRGGTALKGKIGVEGAPDQTFSISLKGFGTALDRLVVLLKG
ncbi:MAG TPA: invasion associated locus B family protein [Burkholderiales bacterium]|jgi:invasion protein IalB